MLYKGWVESPNYKKYRRTGNRIGWIRNPAQTTLSQHLRSAACAVAAADLVKLVLKLGLVGFM